MRRWHSKHISRLGTIEDWQMGFFFCVYSEYREKEQEGNATELFTLDFTTRPGWLILVKGIHIHMQPRVAKHYIILYNKSLLVDFMVQLLYLSRVIQYSKGKY